MLRCNTNFLIQIPLTPRDDDNVKVMLIAQLSQMYLLPLMPKLGVDFTRIKCYIDHEDRYMTQKSVQSN